LYTLETKVLAIQPVKSLSDDTRVLFKTAGEDDLVVISEKTVFHPQGGGQPSDTGIIRKGDIAFEVTTARQDAKGHVLHLGRFTTEDHFKEDEIIEQTIDSEKRLLYSRYHTGGHVLGAAVRHLLEKQVEGFDEIKASHFPDSASCEFKGTIDGKHKEAIQSKVDEYVKKAMAVEVDWWTEEDFLRCGCAMPDSSIIPPYRVVKIVGAEVYPCGGTHVHDTSKCGPITVKKISRSKGTSKVSYLMK
jgi:Ser-tRNA(Ala) deacylase AlaX